ncbi:DnaJ domain-containing protein [bacterium]|nr:DnaJ domain-containing protein [bacterium]
MTDAPTPDTIREWLAQTPLGELADEIARRLAEAHAAGYRDGHAAGRHLAAEQRQAAYQEGEAAATQRVTTAHERQRAEWETLVTARVAAEFERKQAEWEATRAEATLKEAEERGLAFERLMRDRERTIELRMQAQLDEARRKGYQEGAQLGPRRGLGIEGSRSWALGVMHLSDEATLDEIRQRFRKLSLLMHPDRQPGLDDAYIKNLQRARDILGG